MLLRFFLFCFVFFLMTVPLIRQTERTVISEERYKTKDFIEK